MHVKRRVSVEKKERKKRKKEAIYTSETKARGEEDESSQLIQTDPACRRLAMLSAWETSRLNTAEASP